LERLAVEAFNRHLENTPFRRALELPSPALPVLSHRAHPATVDRIKRSIFRFWPEDGRGF
jgi:hypothetical protein